MSPGRSFSVVALALLLVSPSRAVHAAETGGRCALEIAYVEGGDAPSVYWMRVCGESIEFQPLGRRARIRHVGARQLASLYARIESPDYVAAMQELMRDPAPPDVPPDHAFYALKYRGRTVRLTPDRIPRVVRDVFKEANDLFHKHDRSYRDYLDRR